MRRQVSKHEDLPESSDPIWQEWAGPVLDTLDRPKTTEELKNWARSSRVEIGKLINTLSWLDLRGLVETERTDDGAVWKLAPRRPPPMKLAAPSRCTRCKGMMKIEPERFACMTCGHSVYPPGEFAEDQSD